MKNTLAYFAIALVSFVILSFVVKPIVTSIDASMHQVTAALAGQR